MIPQEPAAPPPATAPREPKIVPPEQARARLDRLGQSTAADATLIAQSFAQAAGRLTILSGMLSEEAAAGLIGARAMQTQQQIATALTSVARVRRTFLTEQGSLLEVFAAPRVPDTAPAQVILTALAVIEDRVLACTGTVREPLRRAAADLDHQGVRIVLGATDVSGAAAARIAVYGRRLKELARLFGDLGGAIEIYQQGVLGGVGRLRRDLGVPPNPRYPSGAAGRWG